MSETRYRPIDIDFEVYQLVVLEKQGFDESDNDALRRLLDLDISERAEPPPPPVSGSWQGKGIVLPQGTALRMEYRGLERNGEAAGGKWRVEGGSYNTPPQAAAGVARTEHGGKTQRNGWKLRRVKRPWDAGRIPLDDLRAGKAR